MYLASFYKVKNELFYTNLKKYNKFGVPVTLWGSLQFTQWSG